MYRATVSHRRGADILRRRRSAAAEDGAGGGPNGARTGNAGTAPGATAERTTAACDSSSGRADDRAKPAASGFGPRLDPAQRTDSVAEGRFRIPELSRAERTGHDAGDRQNAVAFARCTDRAFYAVGRARRR